MSQSHEKLLHCLSLLLSWLQKLPTRSPLHTFLSSSLKIVLIYPDVCLLLDKTHVEGEHAGASENAAAVLIGLSFTVWSLCDWLIYGNYYATTPIFLQLFQVFVALFKSNTVHHSEYRTVFVFFLGGMCVFHVNVPV